MSDEVTPEEVSLDTDFLDGTDDATEETEETTESSEEGTSEDDSGSEDETQDSEGEDEDEAPKEEEEDLEKTVAKTTFKDIKAKYPNLFKDFPDLRNAFFRGQEYSRHFSTVEEAKEAAERLQVFEQLEESVMEGNSEFLLKSLPEQEFKQFTENFLTTLHKTNPPQFFKVIQPVLASAIREAISEGTQSNNKNLAAAGKILSQYFFKSYNPPESKREERAPDPKLQKLESELQDTIRQKHQEFSTSVNEDASSYVNKQIEKMLDPKRELPAGIRKALGKQIYEELNQRVTKDASTRALMEKLWKNARASKYSAEWKPRILNAWLGRVKVVLPSVVAKHKAEAFPTVGKTQTTNKRMQQTSGKGIGGNKKPDPKMSDEDFLNSL